MATLDDYEKTAWVDGTAPAINAVHLLNIEYGIERATEAIQTIENNPYTLPIATEANIGGVKIRVIDNGDGTFNGEIWV